jgi:hypothetical protein
MGCPPLFPPGSEVQGMNKMRNEFRELVLITVLLYLLVLTLIWF